METADIILIVALTCCIPPVMVGVVSVVIGAIGIALSPFIGLYLLYERIRDRIDIWRLRNWEPGEEKRDLGSLGSVIISHPCISPNQIMDSYPRNKEE